MDPVLGLPQPEARAADHHVDLVIDPEPDERVEAEGARHVVDEREHVRREVVLQLGVLVEVVQHDLRHSIPLEDDHQPLSGAPGGLVADVGDARDLAVPD